MIHKNLNNGSNNRIACPICKKLGKSIEMFTVRSLTRKELLDSIREQHYFFCTDPDCEVVYYSLSQEVISKHQIKTRVGLKEKEAPRSVCYCFGHTIEDIHDEIREKGRSTVEKEISDKIRAGLCHCEDANPEGRCCLGNIALAVKEAFRLCGEAKDEKNSGTALPDCCKSPMVHVE